MSTGQRAQDAGQYRNMAKKKKRKQRESKRYTKYKVDGGKVTRPRNCPRCGPGVFLAASSNRIHCGKCHYTEFISGASVPAAAASGASVEKKK